MSYIFRGEKESATFENDVKMKEERVSERGKYYALGYNFRNDLKYDNDSVMT